MFCQVDHAAGAHAAGLEMPSDDALPRRREPALIAIDTVREVNSIVHEVTGQRADLSTLVPAGMAERDPENKLFARGPRFR